MQILPHVGGEVGVRGDADDQDVHDLSLADLDELGAAGTGSKQLAQRPADPLDARISDPFNAHPRHTACGRRLLGAAAWAFGVAGLIAALGVANAVVYGVMMLVASLSGACGFVAAWPHRCTLGPRRADPPPLRPVADASPASGADG